MGKSLDFKLIKSNTMFTRTKEISKYFTFVTLAFSILITGCSSKPEAEDIGKNIAASFQCSPFSVSEMKKTDGVIISDNEYKVSFAFDAELKGGKSGAAAMLSNVLKNEEAVKIAVNQKNRKPFDAREADEKRIAELEKKYMDSMGGGCELLLLMNFIDITKEKLKIESGPIAVPYLAKIKGTGSMTKAESGWIFKSEPRFNIVDIVETAPTKFDRLSPVQANGSSFNCLNPNNEMQEIICGNPTLSKLDLDVANSFENYFNRATDKDYAKGVHAAWKINVRDRCTNSDCLVDAYTSRLAQLN